ncbi:hypothetical protein Tco_1087786 [Tanacetum coccineum]
MALPPRDQRHQYLRFEGLQYTKGDIADFEMRLAKIYRREVHRVQVFDFRGLPDLMTEGLSSRMLMEHRDAQCTFGYGEAVLDLDTAGEREAEPRQGGFECLLDWDLICGGFFGYTPSYNLIRDPKLRLYHRLIACSIAGRSQAPEKGGSKGLTVIVRDLPVIDMAELVRLQICVDLDDTWAWVAPGPERQPDAAIGAPEDAHIADEGAPAVPAPV